MYYIFYKHDISYLLQKTNKYIKRFINELENSNCFKRAETINLLNQTNKYKLESIYS